MEVFRKMYLRGDLNQLVATLELIGHSLPPGWIRDGQAELRLHTLSFGEERKRFCFRAAHAFPLPVSDVFVIEVDDGTFEVSNIVPREQPQLSIGQYNAVLDEFCNRIVRPIAEEAGVVVELTPGHVELGQWLSGASEGKLRAFSEKAFKGNAASRGDDRRRWLDFVVTAHREGGRLPPRMLERWLVEVDGWYPEIAEELADEYRLGGEILSFAALPA